MDVKSAQEQVVELQAQLSVYEAYFLGKDNPDMPSEYPEGTAEAEAFANGQKETKDYEHQVRVSAVCKTLITTFKDLWDLTNNDHNH